LDPAVWVAIIVACSSLTGPLLLNILNSRSLRQLKHDDYAREDLVAARAAAATAQLQSSQEAIIAAAATTNGRLDAIHTLANSHYTAALQGELAAVEREVEMMREVAALRQAAGSEPSDGAISAIRNTELRIVELGATIKQRLEQTALADEQMRRNS
jgi:hypothetical protein